MLSFSMLILLILLSNNRFPYLEVVLYIGRATVLPNTANSFCLGSSGSRV